MDVGYDQDFDTADTFDAVTYWEDYAEGDWDEGDAVDIAASPVGADD